MTRSRVLPGKLKRLVWILASAIVIIAVIGFAWLQRASTPPVPGAFYTLPDPLPAGAPGTVIRSEPVTNNLPEGAVAWRILYLSTGMDGEPVGVSGLVIAWTHGTQGILPECATSHQPDPFRFISAVDLMVREGFVVVATDYPGRGTAGIHPYLIGPGAAHAVLDSVRAVRQLDVNAGERYAIWGASQGGHATLWAAQSAPDYAPELELVGAAAQAAAIDLPAIFEGVLESKLGGALFPQALAAWSSIYPDANLDNIVKPEMRAQFDRLAGACLTTPLVYLTMGGIPLPSEFLAADPTTTEPWKTIYDDNVPRGPIAAPLLLTHGTADPLIPIAGSEAEAARRCAAGEDVTFMRFPGVSHPGTDDTGAATVGWIEDRFAGRPTGPTCGG